MDTSKVQKFVEKLSTETIHSKIDWECAYEYETLDPDSDSDVADIFRSHEFHQIVFEDSYYAHIRHAVTVFIVFEISQSGRDDTRLRGYSVYVQDGNDNTTKLSCPQGTLYQLVNSIKSYLAKKEKPLEDFIDAYLSSSDD